MKGGEIFGRDFVRVSDNDGEWCVSDFFMNSGIGELGRIRSLHESDPTSNYGAACCSGLTWCGSFALEPLFGDVTFVGKCLQFWNGVSKIDTLVRCVILQWFGFEGMSRVEGPGGTILEEDALCFGWSWTWEGGLYLWLCVGAREMWGMGWDLGHRWH